MNLQPSFTATKLAQLALLENQAAQLAMIFEWAKTGHISRAVFRDLIAAVTMPTRESVEEWCHTNDYELSYVDRIEDLNFQARDN